MLWPQNHKICFYETGFELESHSYEFMFTTIVVSAVDGTERVRRIPGSQTTEDLVDLKENVSYMVRISALIGNREGNAVPLNIQIRKCVNPISMLHCLFCCLVPHTESLLELFIFWYSNKENIFVIR